MSTTNTSILLSVGTMKFGTVVVPIAAPSASHAGLLPFVMPGEDVVYDTVPKCVVSDAYAFSTSFAIAVTSVSPTETSVSSIQMYAFAVTAFSVAERCAYVLPPAPIAPVNVQNKFFEPTVVPMLRVRRTLVGALATRCKPRVSAA